MSSTSSNNIHNNAYNFLHKGGEMGQLISAHNWSETSVGPIETWPVSLRTTIGIILRSKFPMFLFWGPNHICFYNDAYRPSLGNDGKHPGALGKPGAEVWPEIWEFIKPIIDEVLKNEEGSWSEDQLLPIYRNGQMEQVYWTFSYSPVNDEEDNVVGVFVTCTETTGKVIGLKTIEEGKLQLQFAIDSSELGTFDLDPQTYKFIGNSRLKEWFGLADTDEIELDTALNVIAEADRPLVIEAIQTALQFSSGGLYKIEYSIIHPVSNNVRIVRAKGKAWFNEDQVPLRFNGTLADVTEETKAKKEIEFTNAELIRINHDLDNFIYAASHDLKAPISNLEGLLGALEEDNNFDEIQQDILSMMRHSVNRFNATINDLTEISKLQRIGQDDVERIRFEDFYSEVALDIRKLMDIYNPIIKTDFQVPEINYSRKNLRSIIYNLLSNALKYSAPERRPAIRISTTQTSTYCILTVSDNGLGLTVEDQSKIFGMFQRAHQHVEGTGVGLYMIKRMVENAGGKIEIKSSIGEGSEFSVYFKTSI